MKPVYKKILEVLKNDAQITFKTINPDVTNFTYSTADYRVVLKEFVLSYNYENAWVTVGRKGYVEFIGDASSPKTREIYNKIKCIPGIRIIISPYGLNDE